MREIWRLGLLVVAIGMFIAQGVAPSRAAVIRYTSTSTSTWTGTGPAPTAAISLVVPDAAVNSGEFHIYASYLPGYGYGRYGSSSNGATPNNQLARYKRAFYPSFTSTFSDFVYSDLREARQVPEIGTTDDYLDDQYAAWILVQVDFGLTFANGQVTSSHADIWDGLGPTVLIDGIGSAASGSTLSDYTAGTGGCPSSNGAYCRFVGSWAVTDYVAAPIAVPEPGTLVLLTASLIALGSSRRVVGWLRSAQNHALRLAGEEQA